jgi:hypothetical protein
VCNLTQRLAFEQAMKGLYSVPLAKLEQLAGWIAGNPETTKLPQLAKNLNTLSTGQYAV